MSTETEQIGLASSAKLARLPDGERYAYRSCVLQGLRPKDAARGADVSASTLRTQLHRARKKLDEEA